MKEILQILNRDAVNYVIVGSYARYLQGEIYEYSGKDIDIIVDEDENAFDHLSNWQSLECRFNDKKGWYAAYYVVIDGKGIKYHVDVFNRPLPEYNLIDVDGIKVKVETIEATKQFYKNLNIKKVGGHGIFQHKLRTIQELYK
jgi:hypothetical protein